MSGMEDQVESFFHRVVQDHAARVLMFRKLVVQRLPFREENQPRFRRDLIGVPGQKRQKLLTDADHGRHVAAVQKGFQAVESALELLLRGVQHIEFLLHDQIGIVERCYVLRYGIRDIDMLRVGGCEREKDQNAVGALFRRGGGSFRLPRLLIGNGFPGIFFIFALFRLRFFFCFFCFNLFHFRFFIFVHVLREDGRGGEQKQDQGKERKLGMTECQIKLIPKAFCNIG